MLAFQLLGGTEPKRQEMTVSYSYSSPTSDQSKFGNHVEYRATGYRTTANSSGMRFSVTYTDRDRQCRKVRKFMRKHDHIVVQMRTVDYGSWQEAGKG